jgi:hypothetical protein
MRTLLYYGSAVDTTRFVAIDALAVAQSKGTKETAKALAYLLDYDTTHPDAIICYFTSGMVLYIHSNASYISERKARSRVGEHFFLSNTPTNPALPPTNVIHSNNGAIHNVSNTLKKNVMLAT